MDLMTIGLIGIAITLILLILKTPVGVCLGIGGFFGLMGIYGWNFGMAASQVGSAPFFTAFSFELSVIPLFILMGHFALYAGVGEEAYIAAYKLVGRVPGGLYIGTLVACALFGTSCGASLAVAAIFTKICLPEMLRYGYNKSLACGTICAGGCLGMLIPPSTLAVVYGLICEQSIGKLFIGGIGPGIMYTILFSLGTGAVCIFRPELAPRADIQVSLREKLLVIRHIWKVLLLGGIVLGGIYSGIFNPTEAGAVGALAAFIMYVAKRFSWASLKESLLEASSVTCMIFLIFIGATIFSRMLGLSGISPLILKTVSGLEVSPIWIFSGFLLLYILMGMLLDSISMLCITMPIVLPLTMAWGFDPTWTGLMIIIAMEVGLLTPPMGLNVYVVKGAAGDVVSLEEVFKGALLFVPLFFVGMAILVVEPQIITWLPGLM